LEYFCYFNHLLGNALPQISHRLGYAERYSLALTCKEMARIAVEHGLVQTYETPDSLAPQMALFLGLWARDMSQLKYCGRCGIFRSSLDSAWGNRVAAMLRYPFGALPVRWRLHLAETAVDALLYCRVYEDDSNIDWYLIDVPRLHCDG
jgi:hypothetical protein